MANHACLMIKYSKDDRYSEADMATHDNQVTTALSTMKLGSVRHTAKKYGVIGIDEGQFVSKITDNFTKK